MCMCKQAKYTKKWCPASGLRELRGIEELRTDFGASSRFLSGLSSISSRGRSPYCQDVGDVPFLLDPSLGPSNNGQRAIVPYGDWALALA